MLSSSFKMFNFSMCRVCLDIDIKTHTIGSTHLEELFEKLTNSKLNSDGRPNTVCYICLAVLQRTLQFVKMSQKAEAVLTELLHSNTQLTRETLTLHRTEKTLITTPVKTHFITGNKNTDRESYTIYTNNDGEHVTVNSEAEEQIIVKIEPEEQSIVKVEFEIAKEVPVEVPVVETIKEEPSGTNDIFDLEQVISRIAQNIEKQKEAENLVAEEAKRKIEESRLVEIEAQIKKEIETDPDPLTIEHEEIILKIEDESFLDNEEPTSLDKELSISECEINKDLEVVKRHVLRTVKDQSVNKNIDECILIESDDDDYNNDDVEMVNENTAIQGNIDKRRKTIAIKKPRFSYAEEVLCKCDICHKVFKRSKFLSRHMLLHGAKPYTCHLCKKGFICLSYLERHIASHAKERPYECDHCSFKCAEKYSLIDHIRIHTGEKPYTCGTCKETFRTRAHLRYHTQKHVDPKDKDESQECPVCKKVIKMKASFKPHMAKHTGTGPTCDTCGKTYFGKKSLIVHMRTHTGETPHACKLCKRSFHTKSHLKTHLRRHKAERSHKCGICGKSFNEKYHLNDHMVAHSDVVYTCEICHKTFGRKESLSFHNTTQHSNDKFKCDLCYKTFAHKYYLRRHVTNMHGKNKNKNKSKNKKTKNRSRVGASKK